MIEVMKDKRYDTEYGTAYYITVFRKEMQGFFAGCVCCGMIPPRR
jgi:hypothetical protein